MIIPYHAMYCIYLYSRWILWTTFLNHHVHSPVHRYFISGILPYFVTLPFHHFPLIFLTWKFQDTSRHRVSKKGKKKFWKIFIFDRDIRHWWIHGNSIKTKRGKGSVLLMYVYMYYNGRFMSYGAAGPPRKLQVLKFS